MYQDNASDKASRPLGIEAEVEVDVGGWGTQWPEGLIAPDRELELDKYNDQALDSLIDFSLSSYTDLPFDLPPTRDLCTWLTSSWFLPSR